MSPPSPSAAFATTYRRGRHSIVERPPCPLTLSCTKWSPLGVFLPRGVELEKSPQAAEPTEASAAAGKGFSDRERRIIKRYSNRKLYDTRDSRYVTLLQIAEMIRAGGDVQIIDNATKEDKTEVTLALIISEELKSQPRSVPLGTLRNLIHQRGERFLSQLRDGPIGRLIPGVVETKAGGEGVPGTEGGAPSVQTDETGQVIATPERAADAAALESHVEREGRCRFGR